MCYLNIYYLSAPHSTFPCCGSKLKAEEQKDPSRSVSSSDWKPGQKEMKGTAELLNENRLISGPEHPGKILTCHHFSDFPSSHCPGVRKWKAFLDFFFLFHLRFSTELLNISLWHVTHSLYEENIRVINVNSTQFELKSIPESCLLHPNNTAKSQTVTDVLTAKGQGQDCNLLAFCWQM